MRLLLSSVIVLGMSAHLYAQEAEAARRFGIKQYPQLYPQDTPKKALASVLDAIDKERYDYLVAHLLLPEFVDEQLKTTYGYYHKLAYDKAQQDGLLRSRADLKQVKERISELAAQANFQYLVRRMKTKHADDPQSLKELRQMLSQGTFQETGDTAIIRIKDLKDRAVYMKHIGDQWFIENRINDEAVKE